MEKCGVFMNPRAVLWTQAGDGHYRLLGSWPAGAAELTFSGLHLKVWIRHAGADTTIFLKDGDRLKLIAQGTAAVQAFADQNWAPLDHKVPAQLPAQMDRPTQEELLEFLRDVRPALSESDWRKGDPITIMQWAIPLFLKWKEGKKQPRDQLTIGRTLASDLAEDR